MCWVVFYHDYVSELLYVSLDKWIGQVFVGQAVQCFLLIIGWMGV